MSFRRIALWASGRIGSIDQLRAASVIDDATARTVATPDRDAFVRAAVESGVVQGHRNSRGALNEDPSFLVWAEDVQACVPWHDWAATHCPRFGINALDLLGRSVLVSSRAAVTQLSPSKGVGVKAVEPISQGTCVAHLPLCCAISLFDIGADSMAEGEARFGPAGELVAMMTQLLRESDVNPHSIDALYRHHVARQALNRARDPNVPPNLARCEPKDDEQSLRLRMVLGNWHAAFEAEVGKGTFSWDQIVAAGSACMARTHELAPPFSSGLPPFVHNINHECEPNTVVVNSGLTSESGTLEAAPEMQLDRALVLAVAALEGGVTGTHDSWHQILRMPSMEVIAVRDIAADEEISVSYHFGGEEDTDADIINTFADNHAFKPTITDAVAVTGTIARAHAAAVQLRARRKVTVARAAAQIAV